MHSAECRDSHPKIRPSVDERMGMAGIWLNNPVEISHDRNDLSFFWPDLPVGIIAACVL